MNKYVICESKDDCTKPEGCHYYTKCDSAGPITGHCNQMNREVNIIWWTGLPEGDPNILFVRKKDGHR